MNGIVDFFQHFQTSEGRIIDPYLRREVQYSTPCYAWAAAALIASGKQTNSLESAASALDCALTELATDKAADNHGDFFTFPAMLAYEHLRERVAPERRKHWEELLREIIPERSYRDVLTRTHKEVHNWNIVALSGEFLRHQDGFTGMDYVERYLGIQLTNFTSTGQYRDPNVPMAYDHFPRHFLAAILERGYVGANQPVLSELLERAAWTSLLIQSPCGELPTGGRSSEHQWNEAMQCVSYEIWARRKQRAGDATAAKAFKRAAHLALQSIQRWVRPSSELWIVKNRFDPAVRHGFAGYSSHSQYNLLAASMLASAWLFADDEITEGACPADVGGFVFQLPEFHKIFANAGGLYLELDTGADPHYNSTGLIRVHKTGMETLVGPSDTSAAGETPLAVGIAWHEGSEWKSLASMATNQVKSANLSVSETSPTQVRFTVRYNLERPEAQAVVENYVMTPGQVRVTANIEGKASQLRVSFPALALDGRQASQIRVEGSKAIVGLNGSEEVFQIESPAGLTLHRSGELISTRNGYVEALEAELTGQRVTYTLTPQPAHAP
jgi:hypothetical protein